MSIKHVAVCSECQKEEAARKSNGKDYDHPRGWLHLILPPVAAAGTLQPDSRYFCTYLCLSKYASRNGP
mgnify:CR=1 FL=1